MSNDNAPDERIILLGLPILIILAIMGWIVAPQVMPLVGMLGIAFSGFGFAIILARRWSVEGKRQG